MIVTHQISKSNWLHWLLIYTAVLDLFFSPWGERREKETKIMSGGDVPVCTVGLEEINRLNACIITGEERLSK